jgi:lipopolysaccharide transport system permease protein
MESPRAQRYGGESVWHDPRRFLADCARDLRDCPELGRQLFLRNVRARYRQSVTGYVWAFLPPLAWAGLFLFLRGALQPDAGPATAPGYLSLVLAGLVFWQVFIEAAQTPLRLFNEARAMLSKLKFPREALVLASLLEVGLQFLVRLPLLFLAWWQWPDAALSAWWLLPLALAGLVVAGTCVGILLLPLSLLYQDVAPALALASGFWLLLTPVGFAAPTHGLAATLTRWNPAAPLIDTARAAWLGLPLDQLGAFSVVAALAAVLALVGWCVARVAFPHLIARFGA